MAHVGHGHNNFSAWGSQLIVQCSPPQRFEQLELGQHCQHALKIRELRDTFCGCTFCMVAET